MRRRRRTFFFFLLLSFSATEKDGLVAHACACSLVYARNGRRPLSAPPHIPAHSTRSKHGKRAVNQKESPQGNKHVTWVLEPRLRRFIACFPVHSLYPLSVLGCGAQEGPSAGVYACRPGPVVAGGVSEKNTDEQRMTSSVFE